MKGLYVVNVFDTNLILFNTIVISGTGGKSIYGDKFHQTLTHTNNVHTKNTSELFVLTQQTRVHTNCSYNGTLQSAVMAKNGTQKQ